MFILLIFEIFCERKIVQFLPKRLRGKGIIFEQVFYSFNELQMSNKREDWMLNEDPSIFSGSVRSKNATILAREKARADSLRIAKERELNPEMNNGTKSLPRTKIIGDGGSSWKAMKVKRVYEHAEKEGKTVEEVAIERFGSMDA